MTDDEFNDFCASLPHTTHVVQWGDADVWKIGGKVFAIGGWGDGEEAISVTFKCEEFEFELLSGAPGCRPAPYLASRGFTWIQRTGDETISDDELREFVTESYHLVSLNLTKKLQRELGLNQPAIEPDTR